MKKEGEEISLSRTEFTKRVLIVMGIAVAVFGMLALLVMLTQN